MSLQTNYWLQKAGFYESDVHFLQGAEPRRTGMENSSPFYQPVDGKAFRGVCGTIHDAAHFPVKVIPILPVKDYPLSEQNKALYGEAYEQVIEHFNY